jgi:hypothetical protein
MKTNKKEFDKVLQEIAKRGSYKISDIQDFSLFLDGLIIEAEKDTTSENELIGTATTNDNKQGIER